MRRRPGGRYPGKEMTDLWELPRQALIGGKTYEIAADFREILRILQVLDDENQPEFMRWQVALQLFYGGPVPWEDQQQAMEYLSEFIRCGQQESPGPKLLDWQQDAPVIVAEVNRVAAREIRELAFVHWWTFLGWFHAIGDGQLSSLIALRSKLSRGKPLEDWEREFYRQNRSRVELRKRLSPQEQAEIDYLNHLLGT